MMKENRRSFWENFLDSSGLIEAEDCSVLESNTVTYFNATKVTVLDQTLVKIQMSD